MLNSGVLCGVSFSVVIMVLKVIRQETMQPVKFVNYSKTSLDRPTMVPTLSGPFREVVGLGS